MGKIRIRSSLKIRIFEARNLKSEFYCKPGFQILKSEFENIELALFLELFVVNTKLFHILKIK